MGYWGFQNVAIDILDINLLQRPRGFPNTAITIALTARKAICLKLDYMHTHTLLYTRNLTWNGWLSLADKRGVRKPPRLRYYLTV